MSPKVVTGAPGGSAREELAFAPAVSRALLVAGLVYLVGSLVDLGILWFAQRQPSLQWQFLAITNTVEAWPRMVLAIGLLHVGLHVGGSNSAPFYRSLGVLLAVMGALAAVMGVSMALTYARVSGDVTGEAAVVLRSSAIKTELLCTLYVVTLLPVGLMGSLGPRSQT